MSCRRPRRALSGVVLCLVSMLCPAAPAVAGEVRLVREPSGLTHVLASSTRLAYHGWGYATARDRLFQMHRSRRVVQGRLAELLGDADGDAVASDLLMRHQGLYRHAQRSVDHLAGSVRALLQAYCDGVNAYLAAPTGPLSPLLDGELPEPWTPVDCLAVWNGFASLFTAFPTQEAKRRHHYENLLEALGDEQAALEYLLEPRVLDEAAAVVRESDVGKARRKAIAAYAALYPPERADRVAPVDHDVPKMSHAWVVAGWRSTSGAAVLHSDPQTAVALPSLWHELRVRGGRLDARGIAVPGCPGFLIGYNRHVAWGVTALGPDQADLFELELGAGGDRYLLDGEELAFDTHQETILVKDGEPVPLTVRETVLGPVVTDVVQDVQPGEEFALMSLPQWETGRHTVTALLRMLRTRSVKAFARQRRHWVTPGVHAVYGDHKGRIGYSMLAAIPRRAGRSPLDGFIAGDGGSREHTWQETVPWQLLPHVTNPERGVLFSANHLPVGSWYGIPLRIGTGGSGDTSRSWRLRELLEEQAPEVFTPEQVLAVHHDTVNPWRRSVVEVGQAMRIAGAPLSGGARVALDVLTPWLDAGARSLVDEPLYAAAHHLQLDFRGEQAPDLVPLYGGGGGGLSLFLKTLRDRLHQSSTPGFSAAEVAYIDDSLADAWHEASSRWGHDPLVWTSPFANQVGQASLGYFATIEGFGSLDPSHDLQLGLLQAVDGGTLAAQRTQSYSQWVDLADVDGALTLLPVGHSEDPESPFHAHLAPTWKGGGLLPAPLPDPEGTLDRGLEVVTLDLDS